MPLSTSVPDYSTKDISRKAEEFLKKYHSSLSVPVPTEEIIEFQLHNPPVGLRGVG
jgi:hypothetical protein